MYDPDAPTDSGFWHWSVFNIPPTQTGKILLGAGAGSTLPGSSAVQGTNDYGNRGYGGPCPPAGAAPHHYQFTLFAVKVPDLKAAAGIPDNATGALVGFVTRANVIAQASFTATYGR
jgi:Raf kinase inhibitor-like YbhB/YbcL family protein